MAKRTAKLTIEGPGLLKDHFWVQMRARNGEIIISGETYPSKANAKRARAAILRSMIDVLRAEGWTVEPPEVKG